MDRAHTHTQESQSPWLKWGAPTLVLLAAAGIAGYLLARFWNQADYLWYSWQHDRNAHYLQGLSLGMSLRHLDFVSLFRELERIQVWGLLHPLLEGLVQWVAGPDHRIAVLPSLLGWVGCVVFGFLLARRMVPSAGNFAGFLTALFILASPGHHAYATDIMLESVGACLSLMVLYRYMVFVQDDTRRSAVWLAVSWSLLFYFKYNYWLLVSFSLIPAELYRHRRALLAFWREQRAQILPCLRKQLLHPLNWLFIVPGVLGLYIWKIGPLTLGMGRFSFTLQTFHGLMHAAFLCFCLRMFVWWRTGGREWLMTWPRNERIVLLGTLLPIAFWFALPKRLGNFLWYNSLANNSQPIENYVPFYGFTYYWQGFSADYLVEPRLLWVIVALAALAFLCWRKLTAGSAAVMLFLIIATTLTMHHPMLKVRHMHSWVAVWWVAAGVGFAFLLSAFARLNQRAAQFVGVLSLTALAVPMGSGFLDVGHAQESGVQPDLPVFLEITDTFQPFVEPGQKLHILCSDPEAFGLKWSYLQRVAKPRLVGLDIPGFNSKSQDPQVVRQWLRTTKADSLVLIDIPKSSSFYEGYPPVSLQVLEDVLREQGEFECARQWDLVKGEKISLWSRTRVADLGRGRE